MTLTEEQADILIAYLEVMEERTNHQANMRALAERGFKETELDQAARALGRIAGRDYAIM